MNKTQRRRGLPKRQLWSIFDGDGDATTQQQHSEEQYRDTTIECIYDAGKEKDKLDGICTLCQSILIVTEDGFPTCINSKCGIVYHDILDSSPEWKFFNNGDDKHGVDTTRCGNPINPLLQESSMGCRIICGPGASYEMRKIRRYTDWQSMPHREKSLYNEFQFITVMAQNAGIPKIFIDEAMRSHKEISGQMMLRGINRDGIKAASIYIACRKLGHPRTAQEIANIFNLDKTSASSGCSNAVNLLQYVNRNRNCGGGGTELCISSPSNFIQRFCSNLNLPLMASHLCNFIATKVESDQLLPDDNTPQSVAAGIIYFVVKLMKLEITKGDIRLICNVSEVTINKCSKKIESIQTKVVPISILNQPSGSGGGGGGENAVIA